MRKPVIQGIIVINKACIDTASDAVPAFNLNIILSNQDIVMPSANSAASVSNNSIFN